MPNFEFHFDLAGILLASVLTVLGVSTANAGGALGGVVMKGSASQAVTSGAQRDGGKCCINGGNVRAGAAGARLQRIAEDWPPPPTRS